MFDSCYVHVFAWTVSDFVLHAVFVFESCLVTILFGDVVRLIWFWFCSCLVTNCIWFCSSYLNRVLFVLCHEYAMVAQLTWFHSCCVHVGTWTESYFVLHIWFMFRSCSVTNTVWRCNSPDLNLDIVRVFTRTVSESVLHIWFMFYSRLVTNTVGWQRCLPDHHICILIWFRLCSEHDTVHSYRICILIWFVSCHERYANTIWTFDIMIWFILCLLKYYACIA